MRVYRHITYRGVRMALTPPTPPAGLVDAVGYEKAVQYGVHIALHRSHVPRLTAALYMGAETTSWLAAFRDMQDAWNNISRVLSKRIPVAPPSWENWIEDMVTELAAFDMIVRTVRRGKRKTIMAFAGPDRSGKSTMARWFQQWMGGNLLAFGAAVKELAAWMNLVENAGREDKTCEQRTAYVTLAQTVREFIDQDYWIRQLEPGLEEGVWNIIDDLRFWNEANWVHNMGGIIIRAVRPGRNYHPAQKGAFEVTRYRDIPRMTQTKPIMGIVHVSENPKVTEHRLRNVLKYLLTLERLPDNFEPLNS